MIVFARKLGVPTLCVALCLSTSILAGAAPSPKKGVGMWSFSGDQAALASIQASWFYTWSTSTEGITAPPGVSFVPMTWGTSNVDTNDLNLAKTEGSVLLGFNEPDNGSQSNLSPQQALALWPQLVATGQRLGSPAPASNAQKAGGWLDQFMTGAAQQGLRVDFICLHWYGGTFDTTTAVSDLQNYIQQTHDRYNLPIWLTEFALTNYSGGGPMYPTDAQQAAFASASVAMLETTSYVERYAWFSLPPCAAGGGNGGCGVGNNTPLAASGGSLTSVGIAYATAGPGEAGAMSGGSGSGSSSGAGSSASSGAGSSGSAGATSGAGSSSGSTLSPDAGGLSTLDDGGQAIADGNEPSTQAPAGGNASSSAPTPGSSSGCQCMSGSQGRRTPNGLAAVVLGLLAILLRRSGRKFSAHVKTAIGAARAEQAAHREK